MKILIIIILVLLIYYWIKDTILGKGGEPKGKVRYQSPDEFQEQKNPQKDITNDSRIIDKNEN